MNTFPQAPSLKSGPLKSCVLPKYSTIIRFEEFRISTLSKVLFTTATFPNNRKYVHLLVTSKLGYYERIGDAPYEKESLETCTCFLKFQICAKLV